MDETEKLGGHPVTQQGTTNFSQCITSCALNKLRFTGSVFTWWKERIQDGCIFKRLHSFFGNNELMQIMSDYEVHYLIR